MALPDAPAQLSHSMIMAEFGHSANTEWKISSDGAAYINFTVGNIIKESDFYSKSAQSVEQNQTGDPQYVGIAVPDPAASGLAFFDRTSTSTLRVIHENNSSVDVGTPNNAAGRTRTIVFATLTNLQTTSQGYITGLRARFQQNSGANSALGEVVMNEVPNPNWSRELTYNALQIWYFDTNTDDMRRMNRLRATFNRDGFNMSGVCMGGASYFGIDTSAITHTGSHNASNAACQANFTQTLDTSAQKEGVCYFAAYWQNNEVLTNIPTGFGGSGVAFATTLYNDASQPGRAFATVGTPDGPTQNITCSPGASRVGSVNQGGQSIAYFPAL
jgi:hypothetical protein